MGKMFLIVVDAYSKWLEVIPVNSPTSTTTIEKLRPIFATHGLPDKVISDNGTCFTSVEFVDFMRKNGIRHSTTAPYHPSSNGRRTSCTHLQRSDETSGQWFHRNQSVAVFVSLSQHAALHNWSISLRIAFRTENENASGKLET